MPNLWDKSPTTDANRPPAVSSDADAAMPSWMFRFTVGDDYRWDRVLLPYDVRATRGHVWGLAEIGVLSDDEHAAITNGLDDLLEAFKAGDVTVQPEDEDSHTVVENVLTATLGEIGKKVHAGRSRNDQVLAALRLYLQDAIAALGDKVVALGDVLCDCADAHTDVLLPGYTHMQRAMPSTVALWALGYAETLVADVSGLKHVRNQVNVSPLGSAAGYGVPHLDLPREQVAERLGFRGVQTHATAVQLSRGKHELAVVHALLQVVGTVNRLASDLVLYATSEFGFVDLPDAFCTGSSIMPQKKNPDVLELVRARYATVAGEMQSLVMQPANLPGGYHRDLQLTKGALMRSLQLTEDVLDAVTAVVSGLTFRTEETEAACTPDLLATHQALEQVAAGVPFRTAYRNAASDAFNADTSDADATINTADLLSTYATTGSPGQEQIETVRKMLAEWQD
jgi:argininosuccinate lyase